MLNVGDRLVAQRTDFLDKVTKGKVYEVKKVVEGRHSSHFMIVNDNQEVSMPVSATFRKVEIFTAKECFA